MSSPPAASKPVMSRPNPLRRLYHWVLHWADTPYGTPALAAISFAESSFFPIPPDILQIALSISKPRRSFFYALVSAVASVAGGVAGWLIGYLLWASAGEFFYAYVPGFSQQNFEHVSALYKSNAFLAIVAAAFTVIPFKVFTIAAGVCNVPLGVLIAASSVGRTARFLLVAVMIYFFGQHAKIILEKYFELIAFVMLALLVGGFLAIRYLVQ